MLAPCYLIHGGEPLQTEEIISSIAHEASKHGYTKTVVFDINTLFNWDELLNKCQNLDLFAENTLLELRLQGETINKQGSLALETALRQQEPNLCIIIRAHKLKTQTLNSTWVKLIQKKGKIHTAKSIPTNLWPTWIAKRLNAAGFRPSTTALTLIANCYEGNLLAAAQFIQKISAVLIPGVLEVEQIKPYIDNNTQFSLFELTNATTNKDAVRTFKVFKSLQAEGVEPILVLWAIARAIRSSVTLHTATQKKLLHMAKTVDFIIKGMQAGNAWEELLSMCLILCGNETLTMEDLYL